MDAIQGKLSEIEKRIDAKIEKHSMMWLMAENAKRWFIIAMVILGLWFATIGLFVWYLNQYDFSGTSTVTVDGADGTALYQDGEGNVLNNGDSDEENS